MPSCVGNPGPNCAQQAYFESFNVSPGWTQFGPSDFLGTFVVDPDHRDVSVSMSLSAGGSSEYLGLDANGNRVTQTYAEFGHTASIALDLPSGVTFTSDSGNFLDAPAGAVPEPANWAMMLFGFGIIGFITRTYRRLANLTPQHSIYGLRDPAWR